MTIEGDYSLFAHLETVYLGCLARRTLVMKNVREVVEAARGKQILFFPARHDHWLVQTGDGWAAHVAGAIGVSTDAQASWWGGRGIGTVPHALIAAYGGDTVAAAGAFARPLRRAHERDRPSRFRERLREHHARGRRGARRRPLGRTARHLRPARRPRALARDGRLRPHRREPACWFERVREALDERGPRARADRRLGRLRRGAASPSSSGSARRSTPTGSARRCCAARTTSPPTSSSSTGARAQRSGAATGRTRGSSGWTDRPVSAP